MIRLELQRLFDRRCGYCGVHEDDVGAPLTIDHFQPHSQNGVDSLENLVYCCHACNEHKGDYWNPEGERRILHPFRDNLSEHYQESADGSLTALTETGRFHVARLRLNRSQLIAYRLRRRQDQELTRNYTELQQNYQQAMQELSELTERLKRLNSEH